MKTYNDEFETASALVIDKLSKVKFTKDWKGYDINDVNNFMDELLAFARESKEDKDAKTMIDLSSIDKVRFERQFRGYDADEVKEFLCEIAGDFIAMNKIKLKYRE